MKKFCGAYLTTLSFVLLGYSAGFAAPDPRDSVIMESKSVKPGTGAPAAVVRVYITNKDSLKNFTLSFVERTLTGNAYMKLAWPRDDTDTGAVRRLTQTLQAYTVFVGNRYDSVSPDTLVITGFYQPGDLATVEPPNASRKAFFEIMFDTVNADTGRIVFDSARVLSGYSNLFTTFVNMNRREVPVNFLKGVVTVDPISPSVTVTDPNGGEAVSKSPCPPYTITWNAADNVGVTAVEIWLDRTNGGISFEQQIANLSGNPGLYDWTAGGSTSNNAKIKIIARDAAGNISSDVSDGTFSIVANCYLKPVAGFDINKDGVISLVDAVLVINSVYSEPDEGTTDLSKDYLEAFLIAIFSSSP